MSLAPSDTDERLFLRIVEAGSLKAAAEQLGTDPSSISRRLAALEARLGQRLLRRSTQGSRPTEAGERYYQGLVDIIAQQDALEAAVGRLRDEPQGRLRVTAPPEFGVRFVVPVLEQLVRAHAELSVELSLGTGFSNLAEQGLDVAVRIGTLPDSSLRARRLGSVPRLLVAAPSYLETHGTPRAVPDLAAHRFVSYATDNGVSTLRLSDASGHQHELQVRPYFVVNSIATLVRMVEDGAGMIYAPRWAFERALDDGRVVELLADHSSQPFPLQAVYLGRHYVPAKIRAFIDAMAAHVAGQRSLLAPE
ncbi:LysR family transcriptional regulator [Haliangium ochraceum]|uniref:Transcriptional regulator, LysR family n=1 Tax=Haliangium ochraceum (strain DSM 14365 / JCM 11303 / SMP-2) TaxID=502025 RepID=D0LIE9_HALO1|nr:LysR family transcriptional regulator [Haliangium ochraceum]ACY18305.1 transcriptional regulator, LysR family [Haliangium ochraceum DSM 14365]